MYFAEYSYDTKVVILDNLQFMMPMSRSSGRPINSNFDKFEQQDAVIAKLRQFATEKGVLVFLVIHPRKEDENTMLSLSSIYGSGKATQEADTVLIIQKVDGETFIDVKKNRHDGSLGKVKLKFDQPTKLFHEVAGSNMNKYKPNSTSATTNYSKT